MHKYGSTRLRPREPGAARAAAAAAAVGHQLEMLGLGAILLLAALSFLVSR